MSVSAVRVPRPLREQGECLVSLLREKNSLDIRFVWSFPRMAQSWNACKKRGLFLPFATFMECHAQTRHASLLVPMRCGAGRRLRRHSPRPDLQTHTTHANTPPPRAYATGADMQLTNLLRPSLRCNNSCKWRGELLQYAPSLTKRRKK